MDTNRDLLSIAQGLDDQPEEKQEPQLEPSPELTENMEFLAKNCGTIMSQIQNALLQLEVLLNGNLRETLLAHGKNDTTMQNLENLFISIENQARPETERQEERLTADIAIIRSRISGKLKTFLINKLSEYKKAVDALIENLNALLQGFKEAHKTLREAHAKLKTEIAKVNLNRYKQSEKDHKDGVIRLLTSTEIPHPELPGDIKSLPTSVNPALITPKILEENLNRHYGYPTSSDPA